MPCHGRNAHQPSKRFGLAGTQEQNGEEAFGNVTCESNGRAGLRGNAQNVIEAWVSRADPGDVDPGTPHCDFGKRDRSNQKTGDDRQNLPGRQANHGFTL
jgi:hypothetical protein